MSNLTLRALNLQVMKFYDEKEYARALAYIEREQVHFPADTWELLYGRFCLYALLGKYEQALQLFKQTLDYGFWISPDRLEHDPDLVALRPSPEFQQMAEVCRQRFATARPITRSELFVQLPAKQATALPLLFALHGDGENASVTMPYWQDVTAQGWLLAFPQSSQLCDPNTFVWHDRELGNREMLAHLAALTRDYAINPECVVLGGFSAGAGQAVWMALHQSTLARGFVVLAPYLTPAELDALPALLARQRPTNLRGSILVGERDIECLDISRKIAEIMQAHHLPCELAIHPGTDHDYPSNFGEFLRKGLEFIEAD